MQWQLATYRVPTAPRWYTNSDSPDEYLLKYVVLGKVVVTQISEENQVPNSCSKEVKEDAKSKNAFKMCLESQHFMVDEILRCEAIEDPDEF